MLDRTTEPWPLIDSVQEFAERQERLRRIRRDIASGKITMEGINTYYKTRPIEWIEDWGITYDPRNVSLGTSPFLPFVLFRRQRELIDFFDALVLAQAGGLVEKSRDMGATWVAVAYGVHMWKHFSGASVGFGSYDSNKVDKIGDADSILEKARIFIRWLPPEFWPQSFKPDEHMSFMRIINPETGASIVGGVGDNIGRGGRKTVVFKDESAHYEHPEAVEASLMANTPVQIDMSSVYGTGTVFHRKREAGVDYDPRVGAVKGKTNVFVFDWRDHPAKNQEWYDTERQKKADEGLSHVFAQEVDRDYAAAVTGVIIPPLWVKAAIDAHIKLGLAEDGGWASGLDVADDTDEGEGDLNGQVTRRGVIIRGAKEWGQVTTDETCRRAIAEVRMYAHDEPCQLEYDAIGVGAGVKGEANRLRKDGLLPPNISLNPWVASAKVQDPEKRVIRNDKKSPLNKDFYENLSAQAAWALRARFEKTFRAINDPAFHCDENELISIDSKSVGPLLRKLEQQLSQPTIGHSTKLKLIVNKKPDGSKSPHLFDATKQCFFPSRTAVVPQVNVEKLVQLRRTLGAPRRMPGSWGRRRFT